MINVPLKGPKTMFTSLVLVIIIPSPMTFPPNGPLEACTMSQYPVLHTPTPTLTTPDGN